MIRPWSALTTQVRDWRDRIEHILRWRPVSRVGYDPAPYLAGGRYYLAIGVRGLRAEHEYELSRDDMKMLAEAIPDLLKFVDEQWPEPKESA